MSDTPAVYESVLRFARQHISSAAKIIHLKSQASFASWVAWVENGNQERFKLLIREKDGRPFIEFSGVRPQAPPPPRPTLQPDPKDPQRSPQIMSVRHHLDTRYDLGEISYAEYLRRLRLIGQR